MSEARIDPAEWATQRRLAKKKAEELKHKRLEDKEMDGATFKPQLSNKHYRMANAGSRVVERSTTQMVEDQLRKSDIFEQPLPATLKMMNPSKGKSNSNHGTDALGAAMHSSEAPRSPVKSTQDRQDIGENMDTHTDIGVYVPDEDQMERNTIKPNRRVSQAQADAEFSSSLRPEMKNNGYNLEDALSGADTGAGVALAPRAGPSSRINRRNQLASDGTRSTPEPKKNLSGNNDARTPSTGGSSGPGSGSQANNRTSSIQTPQSVTESPITWNSSNNLNTSNTTPRSASASKIAKSQNSQNQRLGAVPTLNLSQDETENENENENQDLDLDLKKEKTKSPRGGGGGVTPKSPSSSVSIPIKAAKARTNLSLLKSKIGGRPSRRSRALSNTNTTIGGGGQGQQDGVNNSNNNNNSNNGTIGSPSRSSSMSISNSEAGLISAALVEGQGQGVANKEGGVYVPRSGTAPSSGGRGARGEHSSTGGKDPKKDQGLSRPRRSEIVREPRLQRRDTMAKGNSGNDVGNDGIDPATGEFISMPGDNDGDNDMNTSNANNNNNNKSKNDSLNSSKNSNSLNNSLNKSNNNSNSKITPAKSKSSSGTRTGYTPRTDEKPGPGKHGSNNEFLSMFENAANDPAAYATPSAAQASLVCCDSCGRKFNEKALERHSKVCVKVFVEKPQVFDTQQMRIKSVAAEGSNQEMILAVLKDRKGATSPVPNGKTNKKGASSVRSSRNGASSAYMDSTDFGSNSVRSSAVTDATDVTDENATPNAKNAKKALKSAKWKRDSQALRRAMRDGNKGKKSEGEDGEDNVVIEEPESDNLVPCPHCLRRFNDAAAERHIPQCTNIRARPKTLKRGGGISAAAGVAKAKESQKKKLVGRIL